MNYTGSMTAGDPTESDLNRPLRTDKPLMAGGSMGRIKGASRLFGKKEPGSPGKLGRSSSLAEGLSKLRGKGALA
jgi:hypothetical protein